MLIPIIPLDIELTPDAATAVPVARRFRRARVLARWSGVPVGVVEVSVVDGHVRRVDVLSAIVATRPRGLCAEAVRRALLTTGISSAINFVNPSTASAPLTSSAQLQRPSVSVAICTRDRPGDLRLCLEALARCEPPPLEVLVIDNAPAGRATADLVINTFPRFRYIREDRPGLNHARNRALRAAHGDIIAFTDDDVIVDREWVGALVATFSDPAIGMVTGLIEPVELETRAQLWFERYGGFGRGCRRTYLQTSREGIIPWTLVGAGQLGAGANMAFRREIFDDVGEFDPALDVGTPTLGGGDHEMFYRTLRAGYLCVYEPTVVVRHRHRRTVAELRKLLYSYGYSTRCYLDRVCLNFPDDCPSVRRLRLWLCNWARRRWWRSSFRPALLPASLILAEIRGYLAARGAYARSRASVIKDEHFRRECFDRCRSSHTSTLQREGIVVVDTARPLRSLSETVAFHRTQVVVEYRGRTVGTLHITNFGNVISATRLANELSNRFFRDLITQSENEAPQSASVLPGGLSALFSRTPTPATTGNEPVSVVVTTCDRPNELRRCLQSVVELRTRRALQLIVVNNRPESSATASVVREFNDIQYIEEARRGSSYARNTGIAAARHAFVAMIDDDMTVTSDWLDNLLAPLARADVVAVTGKTLPGRLETPAERLLELYGGFGRGSRQRTFGEAWFHKNRRRGVPTWKIGGSGNAVFRTEIFGWKNIGLFDPRLGAGVPTGVGEDTKLFYDILLAGYSIVYEPSAMARHFHRVTTAGLKQQLYAYSKGHVAYHLITFLEHRDFRALIRIFIELPLAFLERAWEKVCGRYAYPWSLLAVELAGTLAGPWSLWRATREARRISERSRRFQNRGTSPHTGFDTGKPLPVELNS